MSDEMRCDGIACSTVAKWSIANVIEPRWCCHAILAAFACGVHLNQVLQTMQWEMDVVEIRDLTEHNKADAAHETRTT